jgi:paraquat-inducible protein A
MEEPTHISETCHECALPLHIPHLEENQRAQCPRCGLVITAKHRNSVERVLAFSVTALVCLMGSLQFGFLSFRTNGGTNRMDMPSSFMTLTDSEYPLLALVELLTIYAFPAVILLGLIYVLAHLRRGLYPSDGERVLKVVFALLPWSMAEIFFLGTLVSLVKVTSIAEVEYGPGFFGYLMFAASMSAALVHVDKWQIYRHLEQVKSKTQSTEVKRPVQKPLTLRGASRSIQTTWALLVTSMVLYLPANLLPVMTTDSFGKSEPNTIIGGVISLWNSGSIPVALVIFVASVLVPVCKMVALVWLNYSVQAGHTRRTAERMRLYRLAEFVGRWSMVDVFVVIILVSLIQLENTMTIEPGVATLAFTAVVIITMLAAMSFEPRLIWTREYAHAPRE